MIQAPVIGAFEEMSLWSIKLLTLFSFNFETSGWDAATEIKDGALRAEERLWQRNDLKDASCLPCETSQQDTLDIIQGVGEWHVFFNWKTENSKFLVEWKNWI